MTDTINYEQRSKFTRELPVALNDHELQTYGRMLAEKVREEELLEEKKKQAMKEHNGRIQTVRNDIKRIAEARAKGAELRPVECAERLHGNVIEIVRLDSSIVVDTRPADLRDLQTTIPGTESTPSEGEEGKVIPFLSTVPMPEGFDEGPRDLGPDAPPAFDTSDVETFSETGVEAEGTGKVIDGEGERIGEVVTSSSGDAVYVGDNTDCPACDAPIEDDQEATVDDNGTVIHTSCAPEPDPDLPPPTFSATIGESAAAKAPRKRERSKKANAEKKSSKKK